MYKAALFVFALVAALGAASLPLRAQQDSGLPPGDGRDIVAATCSQCHSLNAVTQLREGKAAWRHQIYDMIERGAQVSPSEIDVMVNYLAAHFGPGIPFPGATPAHITLAAGNAETIVDTRCSLCHGIDRVIAVKRTRTQWNTIVARMVYLGAAITPDQTKAVVDYLAANYGSDAKP
jgi:sulfite dehydrogenase (cytochrome) subunit B